MEVADEHRCTSMAKNFDQQPEKKDWEQWTEMKGLAGFM